MIVRLLCKNNKYKDFGNHTGFTICERVINEIIPGVYYSFEVKENGWYYMIGNKGGYSGRSFHPQTKSVPDRNNLNYFFYSIVEMRKMKFKKIK